MLTLFLAIALVILLIAGMAIGVIMGRKPLAGSCGGVGAALGEEDYECDLCGGDPKKCESIQGKRVARMIWPTMPPKNVLNSFPVIARSLSFSRKVTRQSPQVRCQTR